MKIEDVRPGYVVHTYGVLTLLSTMALFGYEVAKPGVGKSLLGSEASKMSALSTPMSGAEIIYPMPEMPGRSARPARPRR